MNHLKIGIATLVFFAFPLAGCKEEIKKTTSPPIEIKVGNPLQKSIVEWDEYTGRFKAVKEVEIRARVSGYLNEVLFKDGQLVEKGDTLFVIDQRPFQIALDSASAQYSLTQKEYERANKLRQTGATSQEELDRRIQELKVAQSALDSAKLDMEFTQVKAPISGRVSRDYVNVGNLVSGNVSNATLLTSIVAIDPIHFYFEASERNFLKYSRLDRSGGREGSRTKANPIEIKLQDETGYPHKGKMDFVENRLDQSTGTIQGRAIIPNPDGFLQPGLFGRARLLGSAEYTAILIPDVLISNDQAQKFVYVINDQNIVEMRSLELGPTYQEKWRIVRKGLVADDQIVARGIQRIRPGMKVTPYKVNLEDEYVYVENEKTKKEKNRKGEKS
ncbi:efflux RND transporter periplasmic adaptor subunit [Marinibactrum halimedae]|uniref:MexE family multidrug efflux RND transporter periplasmic adaptor subunit n=1 Tax=Marinibactrum halimedae TaxID=1444977 RepID=A0AA37TC07_9GAMM|nr:efflux RND transporter periplasmic adaptor subunit [Marinibactrum halimedae]MCD9459441.1 efflux RND transporter periplasmic adaptor subunit [Marinibactrum halimedae]GLS27491.1 MexE family multidrug efflux RND transporter periplasmic adaptor subunit [Marinibactrum halimedae]